jgi:hypothetical protein
VVVALVVLIVWTLVAFVALALARTLCAAAARADAEHADPVRCPVEPPRYTAGSTSPDPTPHVVIRGLARR